MKNFILAASILMIATTAQAWSHHNDYARADAYANSKSQSTAVSNSNANQSQGQHQGQNQSQKAYGGSSRSYAEGGNSYAQGGKALSGSLSGAVSGGNEQNITIQGDEADKIPAASAIAGNASQCVEVLAAQGMDGGFSIGGASAECQAMVYSEFAFMLAASLRDTDPEMADKYLDLGHKYAQKAAPGTVQTAVRDLKETSIDAAVIIGIARLVSMGF